MKATIRTSVGEIQRGTRRIPCCMCKQIVTVEVATTLNPEAPEMLHPPAGAWVGMLAQKSGPEWIACCSDGCLRNLLCH